MKKLVCMGMWSASLVLVIHLYWGKHRVAVHHEVSATVITHDCTLKQIQGPTISQHADHIPLYRIPTVKKEISYESPLTNHAKISYYQTADNPRTYGRSIDLADLAMLEVPHPDQRWVHVRQSPYHVTEFIEIVVTLSALRAVEHYLIESNRSIIGRVHNKTQEIPLYAVQSLIMHGVDSSTI